MNQIPPEENLPEKLRETMRHWTTGVAVVTGLHQGVKHGMTVNSFTSVSLDPPIVSVALANETRTQRIVLDSGFFGVSILSKNQMDIADRFAGKIHESGNRFLGISALHLINDTPLIPDSIAYLNCRVVYTHSLKHSTLVLGEVIAAADGLALPPLVYHNRRYSEFHEEG